MPDRTPAKPVARRTRSTCCYCGVGCGVLIDSLHHPDGREEVVGVTGDPDHPANFGRLCTKGSTLHLTAAPHRYAQVRAAHPALRHNRADALAPAGWDDALDHVAQRLADIVQRHGPDAVAFYVSGQLLTEDYYVFNKLAKGLIGTNNIDSNSRLCMSSAVAGYKGTFGVDAPPCSYEDVELAGTVFVAGANPAYAHPVLYRRLEEARARHPGMRVIVADPRRTDTAQGADLFLPLQPGTDVVLFHGMLHVMLWEGLIDRAYIDAHTEGFDALRAVVHEFTPGVAARLCGLKADDIVTAARWFAQGPTLSLYCQGLNQSTSGTANNRALINLHLATGQIGKPGAGPFSLTGQPNAMGGREVGAMANLLSGHRNLGNPAHRAEIARLWDVPSVPMQPGKTAVEIFDGLRDGTIKAVWIACTNPAQSLPSQTAVRAALSRAEFVVVQEAYRNTATVPYADVLLPASTWGEKEGTVTNSERRISRVRAALAPFGESRHDWRIVCDVARRLEARLRPGQATLFPYDSPEAIWLEHRATTIGRDLDIGGLSYALLETEGPQQWPFPEGAAQGRQRLFSQGRFHTGDGRARFADVPYTPLAEAIDARYPFSLNTGRLRDQWHGMSRTGSLEQSFGHAAEPAVDLHPRDVERLGLREGAFVHLTSRRGSQILPVHVTDSVAPGQAFVAMHWGEEYVSGVAGRQAAFGVNSLTLPALDPHSMQPELKHCALRILPAELPWQWIVFAWLPADEVLLRQMHLRRYFKCFPYASCVPFGRPGGTYSGLSWSVAAYERADDALQQEIETLFGLAGAPQAKVLSYRDHRRGTTRRLRIEDGVLQAVSLAGDVSAAGWLREMLESGQTTSALGRLLLLPSRTAPAGVQPRGKTVCNCNGVTESQINACLADRQGPPEARLRALQDTLKCGTTCGSCLPELRRMVAPAVQH